MEFHKLLSDGAHPHKHDQAYFVPSLYVSQYLKCMCLEHFIVTCMHVGMGN